MIISVTFKKVCIETQNTILDEIGIDETEDENDLDAVICLNGETAEKDEDIIEINDSSDDEERNESSYSENGRRVRRCRFSPKKRKSLRVKRSFRRNYYEEDSPEEITAKKIRERRTSNNNIISNLECEICHFIFKTKILLEEHKLLHTDKNELRQFKCAQCIAAFKTAHLLKQHEVCHSEKKHKCSHCKKDFRHLRNLISHRASVNCIYNGSAPSVM